MHRSLKLMIGKYPLLALATCLLLACETQDNPQEAPMEKSDIEATTTTGTYPRLKQLAENAPVAKRIASERQYHGETLHDPYFWLKYPEYPKPVADKDILDYLKAENAYHASFLQPHKKLVDTIFEEFKGRTDETETSVPYVDNGYEYRWYYREGEEYRTHSRKQLASGKEKVFLDQAALAKDHKYFVVSDWAISPDNRILAYSVDTNGSERYQVRLKNLDTGEYLPDVLNDVEGHVAFSSDSKHLVYALLESDRWKAKQIKAHKLGDNQTQDRTLYEEKDDGFYIGFDQTSSKKYFVISASQNEIEESYVIPADLSQTLQQVVSRDKGFEHSIDHAHGYFYILANDTHKNFRLVRSEEHQPTPAHWQTLIQGSNTNYLLNLQTFDKFMVIKQRDSGLDKISILNYPVNSTPKNTSITSHDISFPEEVFSARIGINPQFDSSVIRVNYTSMITPRTVFDYELKNKTLLTRKVAKIPSGYDKNLYTSERIMLPARDGTPIPTTIMYKKGFKKDGSQPLWLYGYGAYGATMSPEFSTMRLSALDRGFAYAIAHVRGGAMMGYQWYLDGKLKLRSNTFNDFVDVARGLIKNKYVSAGNISVSGRSAGGELMGAVTLQAPELWRSVNLGVPFVDVLNTMLDASLPLTPPEWKEWGNPIASAEDFALIKSYSPYDNIEKRAYPPMYVSGGLNDPRVTYWEPAKWTAKMREMKTDDNLLVMRINMGAGHFANSGRYGRLMDFAEEYAFMFLAHGIKQ